MKEFKSFHEQLKILKSRGLIIRDDFGAENFLKNNNYYNVINGYKDFFIDSSIGNEEKFKKGTTFDEIKSLYLFDTELRSVFLEALLKFENSLKTIISYEFSLEHPEKNSYLNIENFSKGSECKTLKQFSIITRTISKKLKTDGPIKHYIDTESWVPLWVLINSFSLGNLSYFFDILEKNIQIKICCHFNNQFNTTYNREYSDLRISVVQFKSIVKIANLVRNICAHNNRLYCASFKNTRSRNIYKLFNIKETSNNDSLCTLIVFLKIVLPKSDFDYFIWNLNELFCNYSSKFITVSFFDIIKKMGIFGSTESWFKFLGAN